MSNHEEWSEFLGHLFNNALKDYRTTKEHEFLEEKREQLDAQVFEAYPEDKNPLLYSFAFETGPGAERKTEYIYRQGLKDCVFLLKELGILA
jgi:hypothetical protein